MINGSKNKNEFQKIEGVIVYLNNTYNNLPFRNQEKYKYLIVNTYQYPFEIFIGKSFGDYKPKFEQIDKLKMGDKITVYYIETAKDLKEGLNRNIKFIEKDQTLFYERGASITLGITLLILALGLIPCSYYAYKIGRIQY